MSPRAPLTPFLAGRELNQVREQAGKGLRDLMSIDILDGHQVSVAIPASSTVSIEHRLGRTPIGWFVVRARGVAPVLSETSCDARTLSLANALAVAFDGEVWVY